MDKLRLPSYLSVVKDEYIKRSHRVGRVFLLGRCVDFMGDAMKYQQAKPLIEKLKHIAVLYHASSMLPMKIYEALDEYLPDMDEGCRERGCIAVDNFKEKNNGSV